MVSRRDVTLTQMAYFIEAASAGSMTAAADELRIAQSAISTSVGNLEQALGVRLFVRRRAKGLMLTAAGAELLTRARLILASVDDALDALSPVGMTGGLRVGCFRTLVPFYLPGILEGLDAEYPDLSLDVTELTLDRVRESLMDHSIEAALTYDLGLGPDIRTETLATVPVYAAVGHHHPLADRESVSLRELASEAMVLLDLPLSRDYFLRVFTDHGLHPRVQYRFLDYEGVRAMVAAGRGFTLLNQQPKVDHTYLGTQLRRLRIEEATPSLDLVVARLEVGGSTRKTDVFLRHARRAVVGPESHM